MADTQPMAPTDAELDELRQANSGKLNFVTFSEFRTIARAVLAKWGSQPAVAGEPVMWAYQYSDGSWHDASATEHSAGMKPLYPDPQPTQAQAGAVPLTDEQIEALPMWKRFVGLWPETRREIVRIIESAHGICIKGGRHDL